MTDANNKNLAGNDLRTVAEAELRNRDSGKNDTLNDLETLRLVHELEVHQIELEMQNEALRSARDYLDEHRVRLEELNSMLEARVTASVGELHRKDQILIQQSRMAAMGEMFNNIAHQWRQPLNTLGLVIQQTLFFYDTPKFSKEFLEQNSEKAMKLINHMSQTIDDFRIFFSLEKEKVSFDVNTMVRQTVALIEQSFQDQNISIVRYAEDLPLVSGYPNEYAHVLLNILINARDALTATGTEHKRIFLHTTAEEGKAVVTIADNAGGISSAIIDKIFDPYFTTKDPDKGTGIGLFMSKSIVEKSMGGSLTVCNTECGAEFKIII
jgi:C4-dicarboxylate-specific signal transduction histidine kinase